MPALSANTGELVRFSGIEFSHSEATSHEAPNNP